jgi:hypothetical protein
MSTKQRVLFFLYSNKNIVGSILGIIGLLLFFTGIIKSFWYVIIPGLYVIGLLATPRSSLYELRFRREATIEEIRMELDNLVKTIRKKVSKDIFARVERIKESILEILPYIADVTSADHNVFIIRQTALDYLPEALEKYLNLPPAFANVHPVKDGKTAKDLLIEQLDLLEQQMSEIAQDFHSNNTQGLLVHGRFLEEKFQKTDLLPGFE